MRKGKFLQVCALLAIVVGVVTSFIVFRHVVKGSNGQSASRAMPRNDAGAVFTDSLRLKTTPVKSQGNSDLCWIFAVLSMLETDHLMQGDSVNLSVAYLARMHILDEARAYYLSRCTRPITTRGMMPMTLSIIERHGAEPWQSFHTRGNLNFRVMMRKLARNVETQVAHRATLGNVEKSVSELLDNDMGFMPRFVFMLGAEYTPMEFGHSVYMKGQYECLTSFTHHPYYTRFALEVPDNSMNSLFLNVPIDTLMSRIDAALCRGNAVCWEGDISEKGFSYPQGIATLPQNATLSAEKRQHDFETFSTTDDHCMTLVGIAHDRKGQRYYIAKNSWGTANRFGGYMYLSEQYVRMKTIAVCMKAA